MNGVPGAVHAAAPGLSGGRDDVPILQVGFAGDPLRAVDRSRGVARIVCTAPREQRGVLLAPRPGPAAGAPALYLDGWSTWVEVEVEVERMPRLATSVAAEAWFAPRAFAHGDDRGFTALIDAGLSQGFALGHDRAGRIAAVIGGRRIVARSRLTRGSWHRMALRIADGRATLSLDGVAETFEVGADAVRVPAVVTLGRSPGGEPVEGRFPRSVAIGLLGPVTVRPTATERPDAMAGAAPSAGPADLAPDRSRYAADPHRPIAHLSAPQGWMNEPHAAIHADGLHHLFFQHNPAGPYWGGIAWGHAVSSDLVHWADAPIALAPGDSPVAPDGIWSGSSVRGADGSHLLYVTAGDLARTPDQSVAVARPSADGWALDERAVVEMPDAVPGRLEPLVPGQFRDPFVWREGADWFMLVGAGLVGAGGAALLFHSADGDHWVQQPPLLVGDVDRFPATGVMWELPVLLPVGLGADGRRRHALFVAPWWAGPSEHHLQHVWHWIGVWDAAARRFTPDTDEPREFDGGGHLTGPSGTTLDDGRAILWTIAQDTRSLAEFERTGWAHNAGLPLELGLHADGMLAVRPVHESVGLRERRAGLVPDQVRGRHLDLEFEVVGPGFELEVLRSDDGAEATVVGVHGDEVWIDRTRSSRFAERTGRRRGIRRPSDDAIRARLVVDGSMVELYVDERVSITSRAYPVRPDATGIRFRLLPGARLDRFDAYDLHPAHPTRKAD